VKQYFVHRFRKFGESSSEIKFEISPSMRVELAYFELFADVSTVNHHANNSTVKCKEVIFYGDAESCVTIK
jgi:hypothetical protein